MNKVCLAVLASVVSGTALGQSSVLYRPTQMVKDQGITIRAWGSGTISETDETAFEGSHSIRVSTRNFFQGGQIKLANGVDLSKDYLSKSNLLKLTFKIADSGVISGGGGGMGGGKAGFGFGGLGGGAGAAGQRGGGRGAGGAGFPGAPGAGGAGIGGAGRGAGGGGAATTAVLKQFRLILGTSDGKKSEVYVPANTSASSDQGWMTVAVPLQAIAGLDRTNKVVNQVGFSGNTTATFYVGDLRIIEDTTPIQGDTNVTGTLNAALGDEFTFSANGFGGSSILRYTWDFDDKDGIQVDAEGQSVTHKFRKPGTYTVTATITDYYGLKQPYSTSFKVVVNP